MARFFGRANRRWRTIVFYSEHTIYYQYFEGLLAELVRRGAAVTYVTSDPDDPLLRMPPPGLQVWCFRALLPLVLEFLDARVLVMTMTDLNQFHLRRSVRGTCHVYVFHALVSTHMAYRHGAFDHYDAILCAGPHHVAELRQARQLYGRPTATLVPAGYSRLERIAADHPSRLERIGSSAARPLALIAPSWSAGNILETCLNPLMDGLIRAGFRVSVRPHPEAARRRPDLLRRVEEACRHSGCASLEQAFLSDASLHEAELLVTDWSGIALEYALGTERPVLFIETPKKVHNERCDALGLTPVEERARDILGERLAPAEADRIPELAARMRTEAQAYRQRVAAFRDHLVFNFGRADAIGAEYLLRLRDGASADEAAQGLATAFTDQPQAAAMRGTSQVMG